jgi:predicted Zn-dependent protease
MDWRKLLISLTAGACALALPLAAAVAMTDGNKGSGVGSAGRDGSNGAARSTIGSEATPTSNYRDARSAIARADYWTATEILQKLLSRQPDDPEMLVLMAFSKGKLGESSAALQYFKKALDLQPNHIGANEYLGELYLELNQPQMAEQRLVILQHACGDCEEYIALKEKIEKFKANPG